MNVSGKPRKQWGALLIAARSLIREAASFAPADTALQRRLARTLAAFVYALKHQLRGTDPDADLACRLDADVHQRVAAARFVPSAILLDLARDLAAEQRNATISDLQLQSMDRNLNLLTEASGACERIANTPIPYTYRVLMNRTVMVYCLLLPVGLSTSIGWLTPLVATFVAYTFPGAGRHRRADRRALRQGTQRSRPGLDVPCHRGFGVRTGRRNTAQRPARGRGLRAHLSRRRFFTVSRLRFCWPNESCAGRYTALSSS